MYNRLSWVLWCFVLLTGVLSCNSSTGEKEQGNHLINETSPYLLQHAYNPVDWHPWGELALDKAKQQEKPILLSIGYAACHWCHVMEEESFENDSVAAFMNEHFVNIKIDREERPDIDQVYMEAAQLMTGSGGWPLNVVAMPDGKPFFAGTYFPPEEWMKILKRIADMYQSEPARLQEVADQVTEGIRNDEIASVGVEEKTLQPELANRLFEKWELIFDSVAGGYNRAPKFPMPVSFQALLTYSYLADSEAALDQVMITLEKIAAGGIYDHLGGGFARYSTDKDWKVPHFEKMLYDNAQLLGLYAQAYQYTGRKKYLQVVEETGEFLKNEMLDTSGGFYSSYDADSEGEEGTFYVWTKEELAEVLRQDTSLFFDYYNIESGGNWEEDKNILYYQTPLEPLIAKYQADAKEVEAKIGELRKKLYEVRTRREKPGLDDKILTAWNALAIRGLIKAAQATGKDSYLQLAIQTGEFIMKFQLDADFRLFRNYKNGKSTIPGFLDDYANTIRAFLDLYQATFDQQWLTQASALNDRVTSKFYDQESGFYFYTSEDDPDLIARKKEIYDNVMPSSNSVMAENLFMLGQYFYRPELKERAEKMLLKILPEIERTPEYFGNWFQLQLFMTYPFYEIAIVGEEAAQLKEEMTQYYIPNAIYLGGNNEGSLELLENKLVDGETNIYVCLDKACKFPVKKAGEALDMVMNP